MFGASAYGARSGDALSAVGSVPIGLYEVDARTHIGGFTARGELALLSIGDAAALSRALAAGSDEQKAAGPISAQSRGGYVEAAYDLLHPLQLLSEQSLTAFARFDYVDTQADVPAGFTTLAQFRRYSGVLGLVVAGIKRVPSVPAAPRRVTHLRSYPWRRKPATSTTDRRSSCRVLKTTDLGTFVREHACRQGPR